MGQGWVSWGAGTGASVYPVWWVIAAARGWAYSERFYLGPTLPSSLEQVWPEEAALPDLSPLSSSQRGPSAYKEKPKW